MKKTGRRRNGPPGLCGPASMKLQRVRAAASLDPGEPTGGGPAALAPIYS